MISTFAYEIGAVFLLAALLMFGTMSGLVPRSLRTGVVPLLVGIALLGFAIYRYGPDLYAGWLSTVAVAPSHTSSGSAPTEPAPTPQLTKSAAPHARAGKQRETHWKTIVIDDSVPAATEPVPLPGKPAEDADAKLPAQSSALTEHAKPAAESSVVAGSIVAQAAAEPCCNSPYDSGVKRAVKSIGHFLHIGRKKERETPE